MSRSESSRLLILAAGADEQSLLDLQESLASQGHQVITAASGPATLGEIREEAPDLIVLDTPIHGLSCPEFCDRIREAAPAIPIIVLSSKASDRDKVDALDFGADDYVTRPFSMDELLARVRAVLRRSRMHQTPPGVVEIGDFTIQPDLRRITLLNKEISLTPKEFEILNYLLTNPRKVVTHRELLIAVWGPESAEETDYLRVYISQLRRKTEPQPTSPRYILTVPWVGYRIEPGGQPG